MCKNKYLALCFTFREYVTDLWQFKSLENQWSIKLRDEKTDLIAFTDSSIAKQNNVSHGIWYGHLHIYLPAFLFT